MPIAGHFSMPVCALVANKAGNLWGYITNTGELA